jgi:iron only hydrogenase large subunit-like protein
VAFFFFYFLEFTHNGLKKIVKKKGSTANFVEYFTNCISICGISNIERTLEDVIQGNNDFNVLEFSNCSMGCIGSRIQQCLTPHANEKARNLIKTIYKLDDNTNMKNPANNPFIKNFLNNNILPGMKRT